jgi:putative transposase
VLGQRLLCGASFRLVRAGPIIAVLRLVSRPRQVFPGSFYMLTRRCTQRQFLLRPDETTNNAFIYCLVEAALRFEIDLMLPMAEANHHHTVFYDRHGRCPQFVEHFHKMLARCMNARWGRWENLWAAEEVCITRLVTRAAVIDKLVYAASNPVKDFLVEKATQWPGTNGYQFLITGRPLQARRPAYFFRACGDMPDEVALSLVIPAELGPTGHVINEIKAGVEAVEASSREERMRTGRRVLGRRQVLAQSWRSSPSSIEPRRVLRPRVAGSGAARAVALLEFREFLSRYRAARQLWLTGASVTFPAGTYWLARFAAAPVAATLARPLQ